MTPSCLFMCFLGRFIGIISMIFVSEHGKIIFRGLVNNFGLLLLLLVLLLLLLVVLVLFAMGEVAMPVTTLPVALSLAGRPITGSCNFSDVCASAA